MTESSSPLSDPGLLVTLKNLDGWGSPPETAIVNIHLKVIMVIPYIIDALGGTKYCQALVGDAHGIIEMHLFGHFSLEEGMGITVERATFTLNNNGCPSLYVFPSSNIVETTEAFWEVTTANIQNNLSIKQYT